MQQQQQQQEQHNKDNMLLEGCWEEMQDELRVKTLQFMGELQGAQKIFHQFMLLCVSYTSYDGFV